MWYSVPGIWGIWGDPKSLADVQNRERIAYSAEAAIGQALGNSRDFSPSTTLQEIRKRILDRAYSSCIHYSNYSPEPFPGENCVDPNR